MVSCIMSQLGLDVGGNFNIHIWACSGDFMLEIDEQVMYPHSKAYNNT